MYISLWDLGQANNLRNIRPAKKPPPPFFSSLSPHHSEFVSKGPAQTEKKREWAGGGRKSIAQLTLHTHGHNERERETKFIGDKIEKMTRLMWVGSVCWEENFRGPNQKISWQWKCSKSLFLGFWPTHSYLCILFQINN